MLQELTWSLFSIVGFWSSPTPTELPLASYGLLAWQDTSLFEIRHQTDTTSQAIVNAYLTQLEQEGKDLTSQAIWIESAWQTIAEHQPDKILSGASLTKIATTLAALEQWPLEHRFSTNLYRQGPIKNGILQGDLILEAGNDPLFVWEEAIALGNALRQAGISHVEGNLIIVGDWMMNFEVDPSISAESLRLALDQRQWTEEIQQQYEAMAIPPAAPPELAIAGASSFPSTVPAGAVPLLTHHSLMLVDILKQMNIYSNNAVAEAIASQLGGGQNIARAIATQLDLPSAELQLINGSGLGAENQLSPRVAVAMLQAINQSLQGEAFNPFDLFPVAGQKQQGTLKDRTIPEGLAFKTGTLNQVSALAGVIPTNDQGHIWFAVINNGTWDITGYRQQQDQLLQTLTAQWERPPSSETVPDKTVEPFGNPAKITIHTSSHSKSAVSQN